MISDNKVMIKSRLDSEHVDMFPRHGALCIRGLLNAKEQYFTGIELNLSSVSPHSKVFSGPDDESYSSLSSKIISLD